MFYMSTSERWRRRWREITYKPVFSSLLLTAVVVVATPDDNDTVHVNCMDATVFLA
jgi:hypothetical protein